MLKKFRKWITIDHCVDLFVDILLIIWDVLSSPILIVMRIIRWLVSDWLTATLKKWARRIAHWVERKQEDRKEKGTSFIKAYWWVIIITPFLLVILFFLGYIIFGLADIIIWILDEIETGFK